MVTWKQHGFLNIIYSVCFYQSSQAYFNRCPEMVELELFSKRKCTNQKEYHCLEEDGIELKNREECRTPEWVSIGNYPLFRGIYIDYEMCPVDSYQPSLFRSNENNKCEYQKSICSSEGQVEVNKGNKSSDVACRCDSNRGFAFVIRPKNQRACISSQEDCSCYSKPCAGGKKLNPDYECKTITELHGNSTYYVVTVTGKENTSNNASFVVTNLNNVVSGTEGHIYGLIGLTSLILFVVLLLSAFSIGSFNYQLDHSPKNNPSNQVVYKDPIKQEMNQKTALGIVYETTSSTKDKEHQYRDRKIYEIDNKRNEVINLMKTETDLSTPTEKSEINLMKTETDSSTPTEKAEINLMKTETDSSTQTEKADIVILHIDEENKETGVKSFKSHLASLSKAMGYKNINIKMFEDVFHRKEDDSDIEIETVLKKCNFVFVYIPNMFFTSKLRRLGLKESFIKDALEEPKTEAHIKIVGNCDYWQLPDGGYLTLKKKDVDLDYFYYLKKNPDIVIKYEKTYESCLKTIQHKDKTKQNI